MQKVHRSGFTLVELLVVIAIMAALAALVLPVFFRARHKGWQTTCVSNQRQNGMALILYSQDYDETYPNIRFWPLGTQQAGDFEKNSWRSAIAPYQRGTQATTCPANPDNRTPSYDPEYPISYAANMALNPRDYPHTPPLDATGSGLFGKDLSPGVKVATVVRPAECIALVEIVNVRDSAFVVDIAADSNISDRDREVKVYSDCLFTGHSGLTNFLFADGHVKGFKPTATYRGKERNFWYRDATPLGEEGRRTLADAESTSRR
jgi:prepilin-type N-terminal cleavage/methylation domain-containing protein/prepilin-type processing-associated H-X9-DG protein